MQKFIVEGGVPLKGTVRISGAKNAAIKMVAASLLTSDEVVLEDVPRIDDVGVIVEIVRNLGVQVEFIDESTLSLKAADVFSTEIPRSLGSVSRSAVITIGPLLARFGEVTIPEPGGCRIGLRPIDRHLTAFESFGAEVVYEKGFYAISAQQLKGATIRFEKNTVMGTENAILAACLAQGETTIANAALEPEVDDLIELLVGMGAKITRHKDDSRKINIEGVRELGGFKKTVAPDRNEAVTFAIAAAATSGDITLTNVRPQDLTAFLAKLSKLGVSFDSEESSLRVWLDSKTRLEAVDIETAPYPGFMTDWQQPFSVLLTQAVGRSHVHETIYENRFDYTESLKKMGADIKIMTPREAGINFAIEDYNFDWTDEEEPRSVARITGPTPLHGSSNLLISDLRAGATLVLAALAAEGRSEITGVEHIDRGYEDFAGRLKSLGAQIERMED